MAGIEKITNEINLDAEKEAAEIISSAERIAAEKVSKAEAEARDFSNAANERIDRKVAAEKKKIASQCEQIEKLQLLKAKQELIDSTLEKAKSRLRDLDDKEYFDTLLKVLEKSVQSDKGMMFLSKKDLDRVPSDFAKSIEAVAAAKNGTLELAKETVNIDGGFLLKYGNIEINSSIEALFEENKEELVDIVNNTLFGA